MPAALKSLKNWALTAFVHFSRFGLLYAVCFRCLCSDHPSAVCLYSFQYKLLRLSLNAYIYFDCASDHMYEAASFLASVFPINPSVLLSGVLPKNVSYTDVHRTRYVAGLAHNRHVTLLEVEAFGTRQTYCCTVQTVLLGAVCFHVRVRPDVRQSLSYKWGVASWGE
jgi:hypothetical protein